MRAEKPNSNCWAALYPGLGNANSLGAETQQRFKPLEVLKTNVSRIVNFGCWPRTDGGFEPFALLWTFDATEVHVVEKNNEHIRCAQEFAQDLHRQKPDCFTLGCINMLPPRDITNPISDLPDSYYDGSFCERVLLQVHKDYGTLGLTKAIAQMARVVRPGGWVIACEQPTEYLPDKMEIFFEEVGLTKYTDIDLIGILSHAYVYIKASAV